MANGMSKIKHVVVLMFENRSFDNLLGWLYNVPGATVKNFIPANNRSPCEGLFTGKYSNTSKQTVPNTIFASKPAASYRVPDPDPNENFDRMNYQLFGTVNPPKGAVPDMSGFLDDYVNATRNPSTAPQIMQSYSPQQVNVLTSLALSFGVSDAWFASCPCQTWPNRGFVHAGTSDGHVNNDSYTHPYNIDTIFNVFENNKISWGVFWPTVTEGSFVSLTHWQFHHTLAQYSAHFRPISQFKTMCATTKNDPESRLPAYSFIEPKLHADAFKPNDYHPPGSVCDGEKFLAEIYNAVKSSPYRDDILFVIIFDEHGGCYDHVPPPYGAAPSLPINYPQKSEGFDFTRFGVRVPAIVVSSWIEPGTLFRASSLGAPYDHTSILATLRDWKGLDRNPKVPFLPSPRIAKAPTLDQVLTRNTPIKDWPEIAATCVDTTPDPPPDTPLSDLQLSLLIGAESVKRGAYVGEARVGEIRRTVKTYADAREFLAKLS